MEYWNLLLLLVLVCLSAEAAPKLRVATDQMPPSLLTLPSNATSIRADIEDSFSCEGREYGYYADVENECQLFHVCLPVTYSNGRSQMFRWSFICPEETIFNQEIFTCTRSDESIDCAESPRYYNLNMNFGEDMLHTDKNNQEEESLSSAEATHVPDVSQELEVPPVENAASDDKDSQNGNKEQMEVVKTSTMIYPLYNRRLMKIGGNYHNNS